jgi:hypothetical protein
MIMGDKCTRRCPFCDVGHGRPDPLDANEPENLAKTIAQLKLKYVVITSVDRDDLRDGGASHFVECIRKTRELSPGTQIEVLVHPESLVHALVGFRDGALMAHIGPPDMRHAIGHALHWPDRTHLPVARLDLAAIGALTFRAPDDARWPALRLARWVMAQRGLAGAAFNAAKERALDHFIAGRIAFPDMARIVETVLDGMVNEAGLLSAAITLDNVGHVDHLARQRANEAMHALHTGN